MRNFIVALCLLTALWIGGCTLAPHYEKPQLTVVGIDLIDASFSEQHLRVRVKAHNPNAIALPIRSIEYAVAFGGEPLGHGQTDAAFVVPAKGDADFAMTVTTHLATALVKFLPRLKDGGHGLEYRVVGKVQTGLAFFSEFPFDERGKL